MENQWDIRFNTPDYVYGTEPNIFYKEIISKLKQGNILFPADGEGRNSVYAAKLGWNVVAYDYSKVAQEKALKLAEINGVKLDYRVSSYEDFSSTKDFFDAIVFIYTHISSKSRTEILRKHVDFLKSGGLLIMEVYSKNQINNNTGGPKNVDMLYSIDDLKADLSNLDFVKLEEERIILNEGQKHNGVSDIIRIIAKKK